MSKIKQSHKRSVFFLSESPLILKKSPNKMFGTLRFGSLNGPLKPLPTYSSLDVPNLEMLPSGDMPGMSTSSIMPFHNVDPILVH